MVAKAVVVVVVIAVVVVVVVLLVVVVLQGLLCPRRSRGPRLRSRAATSRVAKFGLYIPLQQHRRLYNVRSRA